MIHGNNSKASTNKPCYSDGMMTPDVTSIGYRNSNSVALKPGHEVVERIQRQKDSFLSPNNTSPETPEQSTSNLKQIAIEKNNQNMVPLSMLLKRFMCKTLSERRALLDVLPTLRRTERKRRILGFVTNNKKRITRLIIMIKWARDANKIQEAHNLIGYLQKQNAKFTKACDSLFFVGGSLRKDRTEAYDVLSAVDVFSTGTYNQMPSVIKDRFIPPPKVKTEQITDTLDLLNDIIFKRYLKVEGIPSCLKKGIRIENGKFYLTLPKRFEVVLTLLGLDEELPWHLVSIKLFIAGDGPDYKTGQETLFTLPQYQRIMYFAQQKLLPFHLRDENSNENAQPTEGGVEADRSLGSKTPYLGYLNDYLQNFCSSLQLEILYGQAATLASHRWKDQLKLEKNDSHTCLKLSYWSKFIPLTFDQTGSMIDKEKSHYLLITKPKAGQLTLKAEWLGSTVNSLVSKLRKEDLELISAAEKELVFDPTRLNVEKALRKVIRLHSKIILLRLRRLFLSPMHKKGHSPPSSTTNGLSVELHESESPSLVMQYKQTRRLRLTVDFRSGRLNVYMDNEQGGELRLIELEKELNDRPAEAERILLEWRLKRIVDNIRFMAVINGLETTAKLPLSSADLNKFGTTIQKAIYMRLPNISDSYLVVTLVSNCLNFWLVILSDESQGRAIVHMTPLAKDLDQISGFDGLQGEGGEILGKLLRLCEGHHLANTVAKQLTGIDFKQTPPFSRGPITAPPCLRTHAALTATDALSPMDIQQFQGVDQLSQLFSISPESLNAPISATTPFVAGPVVMYAAPALGRWVAFSCLLHKYQLLGDPKNVPKHWVLESADNCLWLTFLYPEFDGCVEKFQHDWLAFVTAAKFYFTVFPVLGKLFMYVKSYDLQSLSICYHEHYWATVGFAEGRLAIALHASHPQGYWNPHLRILPFLESSFNANFSLEQLLVLIKYTLPLLTSLDEYERRLVRPFNIVPLSCTHFRLVFAFNSCLDLVLVSPTQVRIQDGASSDTRQLPLPWRPASRPAINPQSLLFRPAANQFIALYATYLPYMVRRFVDKREKPKEFIISGSSVVLHISLALAALQSYDWFFNLLNLFQRAPAIFKDSSRPSTSFKRIEDFDFSYTTPTCSWALRVKDGMSSVVLEPTTPPPPTQLLNGALPPLKSEDMALISSFISSKINTLGQSQSSLQAAHMLTLCPALILYDFAETLRLIEVWLLVILTQV
ncbi:Mediator of RNA polymerase II transcription subunit 14, variant 2 [Entomophthora muscae]|uniref:Mediator of RNA polymerase II transcription subunit 14, variant 2 n=1 Tax=Entomophthora muscae TaxID=34485 RepID=A0ACC2UFK1_9FUNG|nr:Mediator of RNA polymerase II transcription subunit 14, variant 2 [Entomophthora muscae]